MWPEMGGFSVGNDINNDKHWEQYVEFKDQFIYRIAQNMTLYGITPSVGRLYGTLYFSDEPLTLDEMGKELSMSKTSMSTGVRALLTMNMVEPVFRRGVRKDLYRTEANWYESFTALFSQRWKKAVEMNLESASESIQQLETILAETDDEVLKDKIEKDIDKVNYAKHYYHWLMKFIEVVESGKIYELIPITENEYTK